jgi:hypothetical protein
LISWLFSFSINKIDAVPVGFKLPGKTGPTLQRGFTGGCAIHLYHMKMIWADGACGFIQIQYER